VFVGPELCQNEEWLRTATGYTLDVHKASEELFTYPAIVRPLVVLFLRSYRQLRGRFGVARRLLLPAFKERTSNKGTGNQDMLQWLVDAAQGRDSEPDRLVKRMLFLNMAAIHTTATTATNMLLDLCARPEYIEMTTAIQEDGSIKPSTLPKLKRLDSFMRESRRLNTLGFCE
jgi:ent-kaurene oxidase